jgi:hypothetical protein
MKNEYDGRRHSHCRASSMGTRSATASGSSAKSFRPHPSLDSSATGRERPGRINPTHRLFMRPGDRAGRWSPARSSNTTSGGPRP